MREKRLHIEYGNDLSKETLIDYINGNLDELENIRVKKIIAADPFLSDAVEGMRNTTPEKLNASLDKIYRDIDIITGAKKPFTISKQVRMYAVAATMTVFLGLTFIIINRLNKSSNFDQEIAMHHRTETNEFTEPLFSDTITSDMGAGNVTEADSVQTAVRETAVMFNDATVAGNAVVVEKTADEKSVQVTTFTSDDIAKTEAVTGEYKGVEFNANNSAPVVVDLETVDEDKIEAPYTSANVASSNESAGVLSQQNVTVQKERAQTKRDKKLFKNKDVASRDEEVSPSAATEQYDTVSGIYSLPEVMPQFPGGPDSLNSYLARNIHYPTTIDDKIADATVYVQFIINEDGRVSQAEIVRGVSPAYDIEALNVVSSMPAWIPGKQNGVAVKTKYILVVKFNG